MKVGIAIKTAYKNKSIKSISGEIWRPFNEFNGKYLISSYGRVKNTESNVLVNLSTDRGYVKVVLRKDKKQYYYRVNRLVAKVFDPQFSEDCEVDHKDRIRCNNYFKNLRCRSKLLNLENRKYAGKYFLIEYIKKIKRDQQLNTIDELIEFLEINHLKP